MANAKRLNGLKPVRHQNGSPWNGALEVFYHSTANASAIYKGTIVYSDVGLATPGTDPLGVYQSVIVCPDGTAGIVGVAWTFGTTPQIAAQVNNLNAVNYCPASTGMYIGVITDPTVVFEVSDNGGTAITSAQIGMYADCTGSTLGSATTGKSSLALDQGTLTATGMLQLRILRLVNRPDNELSTYARWEVILGETLANTQAAGSGYHTT